MSKKNRMHLRKELAKLYKDVTGDCKLPLDRSRHARRILRDMVDQSAMQIRDATNRGEELDPDLKEYLRTTTVDVS